MFGKRPKPQDVWVHHSQLPRLIDDLLFDSLHALAHGVDLRVRTSIYEGSRGMILVHLTGWQAQKLLARIPERTLQDEYKTKGTA